MGTTTRLTKFEYAQLISVRMEQLARGAEPNVPVDDILSSVSSIATSTTDDIRKVVMREIQNGKLPLKLIRNTAGPKPVHVHIVPNSGNKHESGGSGMIRSDEP